jgi:ribonuclease HI
MPPPKERPEHWIMYFDGTLNLKGAGGGALLISPQGEQLKYVLQIYNKASNNGAEYEALIHGLRIAVSLGIKRLLAFGDSKVVIEQVNKEWDCVKDTKGSSSSTSHAATTSPLMYSPRLSSSSSSSMRVRPRPTQAFNQAPGS